MRADSLARLDSYLRCKRVLVAGWQVQCDMPVLTVMIVFSAGVFARPDASPRDAAMGEPFPEQLQKVPMPVPQMPDVENAVRSHALHVSCVDTQKGADGCADMRCKPDSANHAALTV